MHATIIVVLFATAAATSELFDISDEHPPAGSCLCLTYTGVNIRDSPCGNVIGSASMPQCFTSIGSKVQCTLSGVTYQFFNFQYGGREGWAAGNYMDVGSPSQCSVSSDVYTCNVPSNEYGMRIHETTSPTAYDCVDNGCGNTCQGGQCVALVTCRCTRNGQWAPGTNCWRPGTKVVNNGVCNSAIAANTAIATFNAQGNYYAGHAAVFLRCSGNNVVVVDQWCCSSIGETTYTSSQSQYNDFYVITNGGCSDRASWSCRLEGGGPTCCPTGVPGCLKSRQWWNPSV